MNELETQVIPLNLQFFAEGEGNSQTTGAEDTSGTEGAAGDQTQQSNTGSTSGTEKTFTQSELTATAAKEKSQGKNSILKLFGVQDEKAAKAEAEAYKAWKATQKTNEEKLKDQETTIKDAETRAAAAEAKLTCITAGITADSLDDALAIAQLKVTDDKDLTKVLEEMKAEARYKGFFAATDSGSNGTGSSVEHKGSQGSSKDNIGARLAKNHVKDPERKSSFFAH